MHGSALAFGLTSVFALPLVVHRTAPQPGSPLAAAPATTAPDERDELAPIPGAVLLAGDGELSPAARSAFVDLAGGGAATIVVLTGDARAGKALDWEAAGVRSSTVLTAKRAKDLVDDDTLTALLAADGIWLLTPPKKLVADPLFRALLTNALERGAAVGAAGADAIALTGTVDDNAKGRLGLVPRVELVLGANDTGKEDTHHRVGRERPARIVVAMPDGAAFVVHGGRRVALVGDGVVGLAIYRNDGQMAEEQVLPAQSKRELGDPLEYRIDLLSWIRQARAAERPVFPPAEPAEPRLAKGALVVSGGGGVSDETWARFVELAGGQNSNIVCIPSGAPPQPRSGARAPPRYVPQAARGYLWFNGWRR